MDFDYKHLTTGVMLGWQTLDQQLVYLEHYNIGIMKMVQYTFSYILILEVHVSNIVIHIVNSTTSPVSSA